MRRARQRRVDDLLDLLEAQHEFGQASASSGSRAAGRSRSLVSSMLACRSHSRASIWPRFRQRIVNSLPHRCRHLRQRQPIRAHSGGIGADDAIPDGARTMASRPWRLSAKLLIVSSVATVIGFSAICASVMLDMRRGEEELARQMLENLAAGIDADISRNIELYDLSLRAVASNMVLPEIGNVSKEIRHLILFDHAATAKHFGAIQVFDADGPADDRCLDARSAAGKPQRRRVLPGPSRQSRRRPVHQPPDAASRRLFHRAEPAHHRRRRRLSRASSRARSASAISTTCSAA